MMSRGVYTKSYIVFFSDLKLEYFLERGTFYPDTVYSSLGYYSTTGECLVKERKLRYSMPGYVVIVFPGCRYTGWGC